MQAKRSYQLILMALLVTAQAGSAFGLTIRFHRQATVEKPFVFLGDIAEITTNDSTNIEVYQTAKLIPAPSTGGQVYLDFDTIRNRLQALGLSYSNIEFSGASRVLINGAATSHRPTSRPLPTSTDRMRHSRLAGPTNHAKRTIRKIVRSNLMNQNNLFDVDESEIEVYLEEQAINALAGSNPADWQIQTWTRPKAGTSHLVLAPLTQKVGHEHQEIECDIRLPPPILTVQQPVHAGQIIKTTDLGWMYARQSTALAQPQAVIGMEAKRNLRPGMAIQESDLQKKPYVRPRDIVSVYARQGSITVKRTMRALKGGGLGDTIPLVSLSGQERFVGRVIGYHKTEVIDSSQ